jgi:hypothetical protein
VRALGRYEIPKAEFDEIERAVTTHGAADEFQQIEWIK